MRIVLVEESRHFTGVRDPKDDMFITCALSARANYLVSGDDDLLSLSEIEGVRIVTVVAWLKLHG